MSLRSFVGVSYLATVALGCMGTIEELPGDEFDDPTVAKACQVRTLPVQPLRRLSSTQYANVIRDLFGAQGDTVLQGTLFPPTVIDRVPESAPVFREETFGPVATIIAARDEAHAIELANGTTFGLGAAVFTRDVARGERIARDSLEAGCCFVNDFVRSDPRLPFGGVRDSGFGRELGEWGVRSFVNVKTVVIGT